MRIVALVPGGIDEQLLFFPTLDDLKQYYPNAEIDVVVEPQAKEAYRVCKSVGKVINFDFKDRNSLADWGNLLGIVRDRTYDVALASGPRWDVGLLLWLSGISTRVGYKGDGANFLTTSVPLNLEQYAASTYHDLLQGLGITSPCPQIAINVPKPDITWAESEQNRLGIQESGYVLLGIQDAYPVVNWQQIIQDFQQRQPDLPVVLLQWLGTEKLVADLLQSLPNIKVTSPTDVGKLAAMIAGANLLLCSEGLPMQLAVAVQTYTIALFGSTNPQKLLPSNERFLSVKSPTDQIADIPPQTVLKSVWGG